MRIHHIMDYSIVNGPGLRCVIHMQGCKFQCPGCFNPETHSLDGGTEMSVEDVIRRIPEDVDGVTISGGEPFLQQKELLSLVKAIRRRRDLSIVIFSGFYLHEIKGLRFGNEILAHVDVVIDGRFDESRISESGLYGSDNQSVHLMTDRYTEADFERREVEITISDGTLSITGFPDEKLLNQIKELV